MLIADRPDWPSPSMRTNGSLADGGHRRRVRSLMRSIAAIGCRLGCCTIVLHLQNVDARVSTGGTAGDYQLGKRLARPASDGWAHH